MELFSSFLESLLKLSPIIGLLLIGIYYLYKENNTLKTKNDELNIFIRDEAVKNVAVLTTVTNTLDRIIDKADDNNSNLKEWLDIRLPKK